MKLKYFLFIFLILCLIQMPAAVFKETKRMIINESIAASVYNSATGELAEQLFTYDDRLAPIKLEYVDFKINRNRTPEEWGKNIGQYNFKLFGCKRGEKNIVLNEGRAMRRDMKFDNVFFEEMNELFPVIVRKDNPYYPYSISAQLPDLLPGYVITAEIKDLFINVCDQYDWRTRTYSHLRSGSAEIKVLWRVMTPFNKKLYWQDVTYGYAEVPTPIRDGEIRLIEKAFADALTRLIGMPGFMQTMRNVPNLYDLEKAKAEFDALAYEHKKYKKLNSFYRRKRTHFYSERGRDKTLDELEKVTGGDRDLEKIDSDDTAKETKDSLGKSGETVNRFYARLIYDPPMERGILGRLLPMIPILRYSQTDILSVTDSTDSTDSAPSPDSGFTVSKEDDWITINNQKPFRYLSPIRLYRIRSSVVAVTNEEEVGSGLVIAPSLVLTNYEIAKKTTFVKVEFLDGRIVTAMVLRVNKDKDVALLYMPPTEFDKYNWPIPLRLDLPEISEPFYAIGTPMKGGFEGALEKGKVAGYRFSDAGAEILTNTNVQSVTLGGILVDENGNAIGLAHAGKSLLETRDGFIPIGDAFDALKIRIRDREMDETPTQKAKRLRQMQSEDNYIK